MKCGLANKLPHVVMIPFPHQGHITPLMQLAKRLAVRGGFAVTFVLNDFNMKQMEEAKQELKVRELKKMGIEVVGIWDSVLEKKEANRLKEPKDMLECLPLLQASFDELVGRMVEEEGITIACIISDAYLVGTQDVANKRRIPRASFWSNSLATFACTLSLPNILACNLDPFKPHVYMSDEAKVLKCIPGISELDMCNLPFYTMGFEYNESWLRLNVESQIERVNEALCIISNSFLDLEGEVHTHLQEMLPSTPILTSGPLLPFGFLDAQDNPHCEGTLGAQDDPHCEGTLGVQDDPYWHLKGTGASLLDEDEDCIQWLDTQKPASVLYISMGSILILQDRDIQEIALGLEASKQPFLWALRSSPSESSLPFFSHNQGKVIRWAPQLRVLSHKAVGGFLTHCGWNSMLESVSMGVPMIGWPQMMDQMTNCWFLTEKLKLGLRLELDESKRVCHLGVEKSIRTLMQEEEGHLLRANARCFHSLAQATFTTSLPSTLDSLVSIILTSRASSIDQP